MTHTSDNLVIRELLAIRDDLSVVKAFVHGCTMPAHIVEAIDMVLNKSGSRIAELLKHEGK
jgi:hypothetical protein